MREIAYKAQEDTPQVFGADEYDAYMWAKYGRGADRERFFATGCEDHLREKYAFSPVTPKNVHTNVPLTSFAVDYARDKNRFLIELICPALTVDKLTGIFYRFDTPEGYRIEDVDEDNYAPGRGGGRPKRLELEIDSSTYECDQHALSEDVPMIAEQNADFLLKNKVLQMLVGNIQLRRAKRFFDLVTTTANMNNATGTAQGGGKIDVSGADDNFIQIMFNKTVQDIEINSYNSVTPESIWCIMNPLAARHIMESAEIRNWIKQSPTAERVVIGQQPFRGNAHRYGLPPTLFGVNILVMPTRVLTSQKGATDVSAYLIDDDFVFLNIEAPSLQTMNTVTCFEFEPMRTEDHALPAEHISSLQVIHNYDINITAKSSGFLVTDVY